MIGEISFSDQNYFGKLGILTWGSMRIDSLWGLKWPFKELQFLALPHWLHFSTPEVAAWLEPTSLYKVSSEHF